MAIAKIMNHLRNLLILLFFITSCSTTDQNERIYDLLPPLTSAGAQPCLFSNDDALYLSWQETQDSLHYLKYSKLLSEGWSEETTLAYGSHWFINWADFPSIAVNNNKQIAAHYLPKSGNGTYAYDIQMVLSNPSSSFKLHDDSTQTEHGFVNIQPYQRDKFFVSWLDGRNTSTNGHHHAGAMSIRAAIINKNGNKEKEWLLDEKVCDCCQTSVAISDEGPIVVYRDRSGEEIRDISYRRYINGVWEPVKSISKDGWKIFGCPVNGPVIDAEGDIVAAAWFTGAGASPSVKLAISTNSGKSFHEPILVSNQTLGRVDITVQNKNVWVSHIQLTEDKILLNAKNYNLNGELIKDVIVDKVTAARKSGFPQMEEFEKNLYFAWTVQEDDSPSIKIKRITID